MMLQSSKNNISKSSRRYNNNNNKLKSRLVMRNTQQHVVKQRRCHRVVAVLVVARKQLVAKCRALLEFKRRNHRGKKITSSSLMLLVVLLVVMSIYLKLFIHPNSPSTTITPPLPLSAKSSTKNKTTPYFSTSMLDPSNEFSAKEWLDIQLQQSLIKGRVLLLWPTIPVALKGSDTRAIDTIDFLSHHLGYTVDLLVWTEYAIESLDPSYNNALDIQRIRTAGVHNIIGPLDRMHHQSIIKDLFTSTASTTQWIILVWLWPDTCYLQTILQFVQNAKQYNGRVKIISVVDDVGIASRYLIGAAAANNDNNNAYLNRHNTVHQKKNIQSFVLANRPPYIQGIDRNSYHSNNYNNRSTATTITTTEFINFNSLRRRTKVESTQQLDAVNSNDFKNAITLLYQEMYMYSMSDMAVGINHETTEFIKLMAPGIKLFQNLVYVSPIQPTSRRNNNDNNVVADAHNNATNVSYSYNDNNRYESLLFHQRSGYIFFGYNNAANRRGLEWFVQNVLPLINPINIVFHIAGTVSLPTSNHHVCAHNSINRNKRNDNNDIICHGAISDEELNTLIKSVKVAINPILEPSGVATKTCRAMALATPVVTTHMDGTFTTTVSNNHGAVVCSDEKCFANAINTLLNSSEQEWKKVSDAATRFVQEYFGPGTYMRNWISILDKILSKQIEIVIDVSSSNLVELRLCCTCSDDDNNNDGIIQSSMYWILASALSQLPEFHVTIITATSSTRNTLVVEPYIAHLHTVAVTPQHATNTEQSSPFLTGFEANILISPMNYIHNHAIPTYCGPSCRIIQIHTSSPKSTPQSSDNKPEIMVDEIWWMMGSTSGSKDSLTYQHEHLPNNNGNNVVEVKAPHDAFATSGCSSSISSSSSHDLQKKKQLFIDMIHNLIYKLLSEPSHQKLVPFVIPYAQLKTCLVGKYLARNYIALARRCMMNRAKVLCFVVSFLIVLAMYVYHYFSLKRRKSWHVLPKLLLTPRLQSYNTNKRAE